MPSSISAKSMMLISFLLMAAPSLAQKKDVQTWAVYVATVEGECRSGMSFMNIDGRIYARPVQFDPQLAINSETAVLGRFAGDPAVYKEVEQVMRKLPNLRIVNTPAEADFVLCFCSQYSNPKTNLDISKQPTLMPNDRLFTEARAVGVASWLNLPLDQRPLTTSSFWSDDTIVYLPTGGRTRIPTGMPTSSPRGRSDGPLSGEIGLAGNTPLPRGVTLGDLLNRFNKKLPSLATTIAALPKPQKLTASQPVAAAQRPTLVTRTGAEVSNKPTQPTEIPANAATDTLRIETALVITPVMVMDRDGKYLPNLQAKDFQLYENNVRQEITDFGAAETPIQVALLLDMSSSVRFKLEEIQDAALAFIDQLRPQDRVMVVSFSREVRVNTEFTNDRDKLRRAILQMRIGAGTRVQDALDLVLTERLSKVEGRKSIVVFTDGVDNESKLASWTEVLKHVEESGVLVYPLHYNTLPDQAAMIKPPQRWGSGGSYGKVVYLNSELNSAEASQQPVGYLQALAKSSGGRYYEVTNLADAKRSFVNVAEELRRYYWLGYYPDNTNRDGSFRKIRIVVERPDAVIRARAGYRVPEDALIKPQEAPAQPKLNNTKP
jgi:Ca-activated chloride channel homolog